MVTRRTLLKTSAALAVAMRAVPARAAQNTTFPHGVASGDPTQDSIIIWTHTGYGTKPEQEVSWMVARDPQLSRIVKRGTAKTSPERDNTIAVDVGGLEAGETYYYAFEAKGTRSQIGRTRLLPSGRTGRIRLGVVSCANYNAGYFTAYKELAKRDDLDAVIHLGDYIYEYADGTYGNHPHRKLVPPGEIITLDDYRQRYACYRSDPDLQAFHAAHPVIATWDDHEVANDSWEAGAENHSKKEGDFARRQRAGQQAFFEWLPIRRTGTRADPYRIYRRFAFGDLASLVMLDTRHDGRARQIDYASFTRKSKKEGAPPKFDARGFFKALNKKNRRMWSRSQDAWVSRALKTSADETLWTLLGNQVTMSDRVFPDLEGVPPARGLQSASFFSAVGKATGVDFPFGLDSWIGYPATRASLYRRIARSRQPTLVLTGDTHHAWVAGFGEGEKKIGMEFGTPGVSSPGFETFNPKQVDVWQKLFLEKHTWFPFIDLQHRGFMVVELNRDEAVGEWFFLDGVQRRNGVLERGPRLSVRRRAPGKAIVE